MKQVKGFDKCILVESFNVEKLEYHLDDDSTLWLFRDVQGSRVSIYFPAEFYIKPDRGFSIQLSDIDSIEPGPVNIGSALESAIAHLFLSTMSKTLNYEVFQAASSVVERLIGKRNLELSIKEMGIRCPEQSEITMPDTDQTEVCSKPGFFDGFGRFIYESFEHKFTSALFIFSMMLIALCIDLALAGVRNHIAPHVWSSPEDKICQDADFWYAKHTGPAFRRARFHEDDLKSVCSRYSLIL